MKKKGFYIAFCGLDGAGQSTQMSLLASFLKEKFYKVLTTKEPTSAPPIDWNLN